MVLNLGHRLNRCRVTGYVLNVVLVRMSFPRNDGKRAFLLMGDEETMEEAFLWNLKAVKQNAMS